MAPASWAQTLLRYTTGSIYWSQLGSLAHPRLQQAKVSCVHMSSSVTAALTRPSPEPRLLCRQLPCRRSRLPGQLWSGMTMTLQAPVWALQHPTSSPFLSTGVPPLCRACSPTGLLGLPGVQCCYQRCRGVLAILLRAGRQLSALLLGLHEAPRRTYHL